MHNKQCCIHIKNKFYCVLYLTSVIKLFVNCILTEDNIGIGKIVDVKDTAF